LESAKECVTTHLPNELALKMDGAAARYRYSTIDIKKKCVVSMSKRAWVLCRSH